MRIENWDKRFHDRLMQVASDGSKFAWVPPSSQPLEGRLDISGQPSQLHCISFSATMVEAVIGIDYYAQMGGELDYTSAATAMRALRKLGFKSIDQLIGSIFPEKRIPYATRGDLVLVKTDEPVSEDSPFEHALGVADPPFIWVMHPIHGLAKVHFSEAVKAFDVQMPAQASEQVD